MCGKIQTIRSKRWDRGWNDFRIYSIFQNLFTWRSDGRFWNSDLSINNKRVNIDEYRPMPDKFYVLDIYT